MRKTVNGTVDELIYDLQDNVITDVQNHVWARGEVFAGSARLATYWGGTTYFEFADWLGSDRVRSDVNGNIAGTCTGNPYGDNYTCTGTDPSPLKYAGMEYDSETQLYHTRFRYYNPRLGLWMTPDPAGMAATTGGNPQSFNRYSYVQNTPSNAFDPLGLDTCTFNVQINNSAHLDDASLAVIESRINQVFGSTTTDGTPNGDRIQAQFSFTGKADIKLTMSPSKGFKDGQGYSGWPFGSPVVYWGSIKGNYSNDLIYAGTTGAHELTHRLAGPVLDLWGPYVGPPNLMNVNQANNQSIDLARQVVSDWSNPNVAAGFASLNQKQVQDAYKKCTKKHKPTPSSPSTGGSGGGATGGLTDGGGGFAVIQWQACLYISVAGAPLFLVGCWKL